MTSTITTTVQPPPAAQRAIAVLLGDVEEAQRVAAALDEARRADGPLAVIAVPPVRGLAFFADPERQDKLDRWWSHAIPSDAEPVFLLRHEEGVSAWLPGLDGQFFIGGVTTAQQAEYAGLENVTLVSGTGSLDIASAVIETFGRSRLFREDAAVRLQHRLGRPPARSAGRFRRARLRPADEVFASGAPVSPEAHPIPNLPARSPMSATVAAPPPAAIPDAAGADPVRALADTLQRLQRIRSAD